MKEEITIKNFICSEHGRVKPIVEPKCPKCLTDKDKTFVEMCGRMKKDVVKAFEPRGRVGDIALIEAMAYNQAIDDIITKLTSNKVDN